MRRTIASISCVVLLGGLQLATAPPSFAQDPILAECQVIASAPSYERRAGIGYFVVSDATMTCDHRRPVVTVIVCLVNTAVPWPVCGAGQEFNSASASAPVEAPCLPGVWTAVAHGTAPGLGPIVDVGGPTIITTQCLDPAFRP